MKIVAALVLVVCLQGANVDVESGVKIPPDKLTLYIIDAVTPLRAAPTPASPVVATRKPLAAVSVQRATDGWLLLHWREDDQPRYGWVDFAPDNIIPFDLSAFQKLIRMEKLSWPMATKADVLRQRVRIGFTKPQVEMALGEPSLKNETETAIGRTELWAFANQMVAFGPNGTVIAVTTTK